MKIEITGLAQETDFKDPKNTRSFLVINNGAHRVEVSESAIESLMQYAVEPLPFPRAEDDDEDSPPLEESETRDSFEDESPPDRDAGEDDQTDETGVSQI